jgi:hypothetical protein
MGLKPYGFDRTPHRRTHSAEMVPAKACPVVMQGSKLNGASRELAR